MQDRYVADHIDFMKWSLLRRVSNAMSAPRLGLLWYKTDPKQVDAGNGQLDGGKTAYLLNDGDWRRRVEPGLYDQLRDLVIQDGVVDESRRSIATLQGSQVLPSSSIFVTSTVPSDPAPRHRWFKEASVSLRPAELVFLDPDNSPTIIGRAHFDSRKYADVAEWIELAHHVPVICISHPPRVNRLVHHEWIDQALASVGGQLTASAYFGTCGFHLAGPRNSCLITDQAMRDYIAELNGSFPGTYRYLPGNSRLAAVNPPADHRSVTAQEADPTTDDRSMCLCCEYDPDHASDQRRCPICHQALKGPGWTGIDAHWRSRKAGHDALICDYWRFRGRLCQRHR